MLRPLHRNRNNLPCFFTLRNYNYQSMVQKDVETLLLKKLGTQGFNDVVDADMQFRRHYATSWSRDSHLLTALHSL